MHVHREAELAGHLGDERRLARGGLDQVRLTGGPHDRQDEPGQAAAAAHVCEGARRCRVDGGQAGEGVQDVARGRLGGIADRRDADRRGTDHPDEQCEPVELPRRQPRRAAGDHGACDLGGRFT